MDFKEFYELLDSATTKRETKLVPSEENFNVFLFSRFLSFMNPILAVYLDETINRKNWLPEDDDLEIRFKGIRSVLPKMPKMFCKYVKHPTFNNQERLDYTEEELREEARLRQCSVRELRMLAERKQDFIEKL